MTSSERDVLPELARRAKRIRRKVLAMASGRGQGYVGQGLGIADVLAALYFYELQYDPNDPQHYDRDRFVLSSGHYSIALFAALADAGIIDDEELSTYGDDGSRLEMSSMDTTPGVEITGGSLGHGLGVAAGMAMGARLGGRPYRVFNLMSDGELQEGSTWEAAMFAGGQQLASLTAIVDLNRTQADGELVLEVEPVTSKFDSFGWWATDVDGNDLAAVVKVLDEARNVIGRPKMIVASTRLGFGVPLIMQQARAHFVRVQDEEWSLARAQLEAVE
jgi:transketolase